MSPVYDAIVLGGGPAGSAAAAVLAQRGRRVVLCEKATGPRYRVGESLIPYCYFPLRRIGALEAVAAAGFTQKQAVQFVSTNGRSSQQYAQSVPVYPWVGFHRAPLYHRESLCQPAARCYNQRQSGSPGVPNCRSALLGILVLYFTRFLGWGIDQSFGG